jgi:ABC-type lipoprotein export system ATPase subunit
MSLILQLDNIFKWVDLGETRVEILKGVSIKVQSGEFLAIMGASGSGKSTLLNLIGLLDTPSSGSLMLGNRETSHLNEEELAEARANKIGFIFQSFNLLSYMTARQNIELPMEYTQRPDPQGRSRDLLERMRLGHRAHAYPTTLSGGEKQRVAIARAMANEPSLLLADELMQELNRAGATILLVTHDEQVAKRAKTIVRMRDGRFV